MVVIHKSLHGYIDALKPVGLAGKLLLESDVYKVIEQDIMRT